jgi:DNA modification methylase
MKQQNIKIDYVSINLPKESKDNPRYLTKKQEEHLTESIKKFGLADPILLNHYKGRKNMIIGGHQRFKIAKKLGYKKIPAVYLNLTPAKERELKIRLNANTGSWDWEMLKDWDTSFLLDIGFEEEDMKNIWDDFLETEDDNFDINEEKKKIKTTNIKYGDMFKLGKHTLLCSDSTNTASVNKVVGNIKINLILCDPPFNIGLNYNKGVGGKGNYQVHVKDNKNEEDYKKFLKQTILNALNVAYKDCHIFYYCDQKYVGLLQDIYKEVGINYKRTCLWIKNGFSVTPQVAFNKCYESVLYGTKGNPYLSNAKNINQILNKEIENGNRTLVDIFDIFDIWLVKRLPGVEYEHPTDKNPTLHEKALRRCSKINDTVLDLFGGGGSTLIACEQLKRRCFMIEKEPILCQLIINRFEKYAKQKAKKIN